MKQRNNYLLQTLLYIWMIFIYTGIGIAIMSFSLGKENQNEFLRGSLTLIGIPIVFSVAAIIINFIINLFVKPKLFLFEDKFTYKDKTRQYREIKKLEYNVGYVGKGHSEAAALVIYCRNEKIEIKNPSIRMIINMKKRCKDKPFKLTNWQFYVVTGVVIAIVVILIMVFGE